MAPNTKQIISAYCIFLLVTSPCQSGENGVDLFLSGTNGYHTYRIPSLIATNKGTLLALNVDHGATGDGDRLAQRLPHAADGSARRRRTGQPDIRFELSAYSDLRSAETLEMMCAYAEAQLLPDEVLRFRLAVAMKLLELAAYRPFSIQASDCVFIRRSLAHAHLFSAENRKHIRWHITEAAMRLLQHNELANALALTPPNFYARTLAKALVSWPGAVMGPPSAHA
jgi:hypothetical protein